MILVTIEYDEPQFSNWFGDLRAIQDLSENVEAIVGLVFAEELDHVDVRVRPFGPFDQYDEPLFFTIDVEDEEMHHDPAKLAEQFGAHLNITLTNITKLNITFRVWVRRIVGAYHESP